MCPYYIITQKKVTLFNDYIFMTNYIINSTGQFEADLNANIIITHHTMDF